MIDFNEESQVVVDEMGMPITKDCAVEWIGILSEYLRLPSSEIANKATEIAEKRYPNMAAQMKLKPSKYQ